MRKYITCTVHVHVYYYNYMYLLNKCTCTCTCTCTVYQLCDKWHQLFINDRLMIIQSFKKFIEYLCEGVVQVKIVYRRKQIADLLKMNNNQLT